MKYIYVITILLLITSCEKVIYPEIDAAETQLVIEAEITNAPGPYTVKVSNSINLDQTNTFNGVSGATVILSDEWGNTDTLEMHAPGIYHTVSLTGQPGTLYSLYLIYNGKTYTAQCRMPLGVTMNSLLSKPDESTNSGQMLVPIYNDPGSAQNFYRFKAYENHVPLSFIRVRNDKNTNGTMVSLPLRFDNYFNTGDTASLQMMCIDEAVYDYFYALNQILGTGHSQPASPANPVSNITGGCLGYFSAHTWQEMEIIIP